MRQHIVVDGHAAAMHRICAWLDTWRQETPSGPWWPERVTLADLRARRPRQRGPARPSWCYGTPGLARAQQLAGIALADDDRQTTAEDALVRCLTDPTQTVHLVDPALCHGWAGVALTAWCAATDGAEHLAPLLPDLVDQLLRHIEPDPHQLPGLIEGTAGVALTLHSIATATTKGWPTCLLLT
jgi:hypothetical protein